MFVVIHQLLFSVFSVSFQPEKCWKIFEKRAAKTTKKMRPCIGIPISFSWLIFGNSTLFQYHEIKQLSNRLWKNWRIFRLVFLLLRSLWFSAIVRRFREDGTSALPSEPTTEKWSSKKPLKGHGKKPWRSADFLFIMASTVLFVIPSFGVETPVLPLPQ